MKKILVSLLLIFSFAASVVAFSFNEASANDKPLLLCISAKFCSACKQFEPVFESAKAKFSQKFEFKKEYYGHSKMAQSLNVTETPSVFIIDGKKTQKISWDCLSSPGCFEQKLQEY